jgi:hypothetical protein
MTPVLAPSFCQGRCDSTAATRPPLTRTRFETSVIARWPDFSRANSGIAGQATTARLGARHTSAGLSITRLGRGLTCSRSVDCGLATQIGARANV